MRTWQRHAGIVAAGLLLAGVAGAATFDRGLIPKSTPSSDTSAGTGLTGDVSVVFDDYDPDTGFSTAFQSTVRLRKGNAIREFLYSYACAVADPCQICDVEGGAAMSDNQVAIQMCIEDGIEPEVRNDFGFASTVQVRLKDVTNPAAKFYPATHQLAFGADIEVSAK